MSIPQPSSSAPVLVVRFQRGLGIAAVVVGALMLLLGLATGDVLNIGVGVILGGLGLGYTFGKAIVVTPTELQLKNPLGMTLRRFPVQGPQDLGLEGKHLVHVPQQKKVISLGFGLDRGDAERLRRWVDGQPAG